MSANAEGWVQEVEAAWLQIAKEACAWIDENVAPMDDADHQIPGGIQRIVGLSTHLGCPAAIFFCICAVDPDNQQWTHEVAMVYKALCDIAEHDVEDESLLPRLEAYAEAAHAITAAEPAHA